MTVDPSANPLTYNGGTVAINPNGFTCSPCQRWVPPGTVHGCYAGNLEPGILGLPSIWGATPTPQPSLARTRLERQIARLDQIHVRMVDNPDSAEDLEVAMAEVRACLRDLAEDL